MAQADSDEALIEAALEATRGRFVSGRERADETGISDPTWRRWEEGNRKLNAENKRKLLTLLAVQPGAGEDYAKGVQTAINAARTALDELEAKLLAVKGAAEGAGIERKAREARQRGQGSGPPPLGKRGRKRKASGDEG